MNELKDDIVDAPTNPVVSYSDSFEPIGSKSKEMALLEKEEISARIGALQLKKMYDSKLLYAEYILDDTYIYISFVY